VDFAPETDSCGDSVPGEWPMACAVAPPKGS